MIWEWAKTLKYSLEKEDLASEAPGLNSRRQAVSAWIMEFFPWFFEKHFSHSDQFFWILGRLYKYYISVHYLVLNSCAISQVKEEIYIFH